MVLCCTQACGTNSVSVVLPCKKHKIVGSCRSARGPEVDPMEHKVGEPRRSVRGPEKHLKRQVFGKKNCLPSEFFVEHFTKVF